MSNIRHRSGGGDGNGDANCDGGGVTSINSANVVPRIAAGDGCGSPPPARRNRGRGLHSDVWIRVVAIVSCYCAAVCAFSRFGDVGGAAAGGGVRETATEAAGPPRFATVVMPSVVRPDLRPSRLANIARTWGLPSRAVYVVHSMEEYPGGKDRVVASPSGKGDGARGESNLNSDPSYPRLIVIPESIAVDKGVQRLQHVVQTIRNGINPDFAFFVNDHTFVIPEHLCTFLSGRDPRTNLYAGHALKGSKEVAFNSGAAGYVLSRATMDNLIRRWEEHDELCTAEHAGKWLQGNPGLVTAQCLDRVLGIPVVDTRDAETHAHRFHAFGLVRTVTGRVDEWYLNKHRLLDEVLGVDAVDHHAPLTGVACCSPDTISFHYVEAEENVALDAVRKRLQSKPDMTDGELREAMVELWPREKKAIGFYAHGLPQEDEAQVWKALIEVVRKIFVGSESGNEPPC